MGRKLSPKQIYAKYLESTESGNAAKTSCYRGFVLSLEQSDTTIVAKDCIWKDGPRTTLGRRRLCIPKSWCIISQRFPCIGTSYSI